MLSHRAVLAITKDNVDAPPTLFKTYDRSESLKDCMIWQVVRATSAATTFFKSIKCGRDEIEFIDAGFGYNNPCGVLLDEAQRTFPDCELGCVLSIGTGLSDVVQIKDSRRSILNALKNMASSSKKVANRLKDQFEDRRFGDGPIYYRFNVPRGLEDISLSDWNETSTISAHTRNYLEEDRKQINLCANTLRAATRITREFEVIDTYTVGALKFQLLKATSACVNHPSVSITSPSGWLILGGGAFVDWKSTCSPFNPPAGNLLTGMFPDGNGETWTVTSKDHMQESSARIFGYCFIAQMKDGSPIARSDYRITTGTSNVVSHPTLQVRLPSEFTLVGGGVRANYSGGGSMLFASYPADGVDAWVGSAKDHFASDPSSITVWAIGLRKTF